MVVPLEARSTGEHRLVVGGDDGVAGADGDRLVEEEPHGRGRGLESRAVGRVDGNELGVRRCDRHRHKGDDDHEQET